MYSVTVQEEFSGAHRLRNYRGRCENLHGHNWKVAVTVESPAVDRNGLLLDFHLLKEHLRRAVSVLDHRYLNEVPFFRKNNPSSENICRYVYGKMAEALKGEKARVRRVSVWENEQQYATYEEV